MKKIINIQNNEIIGFTNPNNIIYVALDPNGDKIELPLGIDFDAIGIIYNDNYYALSSSEKNEIVIKLEEVNEESILLDTITKLKQSSEQGKVNTTEIEDLNNAVIELYEMITGE